MPQIHEFQKTYPTMEHISNSLKFSTRNIFSAKIHTIWFEDQECRDKEIAQNNSLMKMHDSGCMSLFEKNCSYRSCGDVMFWGDSLKFNNALSYKVLHFSNLPNFLPCPHASRRNFFTRCTIDITKKFITSFSETSSVYNRLYTLW